MKALRNILIFVIPVTMGFAYAADSSQNNTSELHTIEKKIDSLDKELLYHEQNSTVEGLWAINFALYGIIVSTILALFASINAIIDQSKLKKFIKVQRHIQDANNAFVQKNYESAKNSYDAAIKINKKTIEPIILAGNAFFNMKRYDDAIVYYKQILKINQKYVGALNNIGACYARLGDNEKAIEYFQQGLDIEPNNVEGLNNIGSSKIDLGLPDAAIPYLDKAIAINKKDALAIVNKGKAIAVDDHKKAMPYFDEALKIKPDSLEALSLKGISLLAFDQYEEALACFNLILKIEPTNKTALINKGACLINLDRFDEALPCFNEVLITEPNSAYALYNKGLCLGNNKKYDNATQCFNKALDLGIDESFMLNTIGKFLVEYGDPNRAIRDCFTKVLEKDEHDLYALAGMHLAYDKLDDKPKADEWYNKFEIEKSKKK